jgi:16S rRNA (guanine966-N2)-methyltransferase
VRIVAGRWRGRALRAPKGLAVRPTSDRVREAIFDILGERVSGTSVLDLFAGSGALGLEALSRGASRAVFVESDPAAFAVLRENVETLGAVESEAWRLDYRQALRRLRARSMRFDLVFLDPPYRKGLASDSSAALCRADMVRAGGAVVVEEAVRAPEASFPEGWVLSTDRRYGDTRVMLFEMSA